MGLAPNGEGNAGNPSDSRLCNTGEGKLGDSLHASGAPHSALKSLSVLVCCFAFKNLLSLADSLSAASFPKHLFSLE